VRLESLGHTLADSRGLTLSSVSYVMPQLKKLIVTTLFLQGRCGCQRRPESDLAYCPCPSIIGTRYICGPQLPAAFKALYLIYEAKLNCMDRNIHI